MTSENGQIIDHGIAQTNNTGFVTLITNLEYLNGPSLRWSCLNLSNHGNLSHDNDKPESSLSESSIFNVGTEERGADAGRGQGQRRAL